MAAYEEPRPNAWLSRNALWAVPGMLMLVCVCPVLCCGGFVFTLMRGIGGSEPATMAFDLVQKSPEVTDRLGEPLEKGFVTTGNISVNNGGGDAKLDFSISGPQGDAQVHVEAARFGGVWDLKTVEVTFEDGTSIDLYDPPPPAGDAPEAEIEPSDAPAEL